MTSVICDLDGVIYRGSQAVGDSPSALKRLAERGTRVVFVTNNSTRTPEDTAAKIERVTGFVVDPGDICTSALAAASTLRPEDGPVLIVGEDGVAQAVSGAGLDQTEDPLEARSVVVGLTRHFGYDDIARAAEAVRLGARYVATNTDPTFPTSDGILPGSGAIVAAISAVAGVEPEVSGKPHQPMRDLISGLGIDDAWVIGDRVDTDIALATGAPGWRSILVLTGVTGEDEDHGAADHVVADFSEAADLVLSQGEGR